MENGTFSAKETVNVDSSITIEHIMPQNKNEVWEKEIGTDYFMVHEKYLHTLGNLTLTGYNSELSDKSFKIKKKMIEEKSKFISLNKDVVNQEKWSVNAINERAERLSSLLLSIFKLPKTILEYKQDMTQNSKHTAIDIIDLTNSKPVSFILLGQSIPVSSYRELLINFMNLLNENDEQSVQTLSASNYKIPGATRVYLSNDKDNLRVPVELKNTGIYFETNLSSNGVISFIRNILLECNLSHDDFIFYTEN